MVRRGDAAAETSIAASAPTHAQLSKWGLDPSWSKHVTFIGADEKPITWHVLDTGSGTEGTIVCVHGNPSWGYLWRDVLRELSPRWRVIAVDQTGMGYSERSRSRALAERVDELVRFCRQEVEGPFVLAAHDWGGPVAVGAAGSLEVSALILANTAVAKPEDVRVPPLIATARRFVDFSCRRTPLFVNGAAAMTDKLHREALRAPYRGAEHRQSIADFVADIPVGPTDPSYVALNQSATTLEALTCPMLFIWGGSDPVFHDRFLRDLRRRVPHAQVERFNRAGHYVCLDEPIGQLIDTWLTAPTNHDTPVNTDAIEKRSGSTTESPAVFRSALTALVERGDDPSIVYSGPDGIISWAELLTRADVAAGELQRQDVKRGDRIALLIPPSVELLVAAAATWRVGATAVVADASAGLRQLRGLIRGAAPSYIIGTATTLTAAKVGRFAPGAKMASFASIPGVIDLRGRGDGVTPTEVELRPRDLAAVVHTSGATGPAKPVRYTHGALAAQRSALEGLLGVHPDEAFTTSFGAFMLLAPSLGMGCMRPDFDVNKPSQLDFESLSLACQGGKVTTAWLSPASARTIAATASGRNIALRLVMLAGAPIPPSLVRQIAEVTRGEVRAPYGMTECLPVTDGVDPTAVGPLGGTATGRPLSGCSVVVSPLDDPFGDALSDGQWGEILVSAPWMFQGYDAKWVADSTSSITRDGQRFHRTGDVGYFHHGVLFQLGRLQHVIRTAVGPVASVGLEELVSSGIGRPVAAVSVGPSGVSVIAIVVGDEGHLRLAPKDVAHRVRAASGQQIAAVLLGSLPMDRRHQSKIDRVDLSIKVGDYLAGR